MIVWASMGFICGVTRLVFCVKSGFHSPADVGDGCIVGCRKSLVFVDSESAK